MGHGDGPDKDTQVKMEELLRISFQKCDKGDQQKSCTRQSRAMLDDRG
jgi:hypothetical protein